MKKQVLILLSLLTLFNLTRGQDFSIVLGSGYSADTLCLEVNGVPIMQNEVISSDASIGIVLGVSIWGREDGIIEVSFKNQNRQIAFEPSQRLRIVVTINGLPYLFLASLSKGKYLLIDKHFQYYNVDLTQAKRPFRFE